MNRDERTPYMIAIALGAARHWISVSVRGDTPNRKPRVTTPAARKTLRVGTVRVTIEDTAIVSGKTKPRAIWTQAEISEQSFQEKHFIESIRTNLEERRLDAAQA